jgi:hypothetical protein
MFHPKHEADAVRVIQGLKRQFELTGGSPITNFLKIKVTRNLQQRRLWLCQRDYIVAMARRFGLDVGGWQVFTPLSSTPLPRRDHGRKATREEIRLYQQKIGSVLYPACMTRPDVAFAMAFLAQFLVNPAPAHQHAIDRVIAYLYSTQWLGICFDGTNSELLAYADASFADDPINRRSSQGYVFLLFGGPILWRANKQTINTKSTTEAEIKAASDAASELIALGRLFDELSLDMDRGLELLSDNLQAVKALSAQTEAVATKIRHIDIHQHWLRQEVLAGTLSLKWVPAATMAADGLTKPLSEAKHAEFVRLLGLINCRDVFNSFDAKVALEI